MMPLERQITNKQIRKNLQAIRGVRKKYEVIVPMYIEHLQKTNQLLCNELRFIVETFCKQNPQYAPKNKS